MYETFYGLRERPFELTSDPRFLLMTPKHREALSNLKYGLSSRRGMTLLIGEAGTGKTSLIAAALQAEEHRGLRVAHLTSPTLTRSEFYELLAGAFGLGKEAATRKSRFLVELEASITARHGAGGLSALIVDEAQSLSYELLEEIRLLANIETASEKLLPVILAGQPELSNRLNEPGLRQLKQRVALRCTLTTLTLQETAAYVATRIRVAGGDSAKVFTREAVIAIHHWSRGIPRTINVICDNVLLTGFAADCRPATVSIVREVCQDFDLREPAAAASAEPSGTASSPDASDRSLLERVRKDPHPAAADIPDEAEEMEPVMTEKPMFSPPAVRRRFLFFKRSLT